MNIDIQPFTSKITRVFAENGLSGLLSQEKVEKFHRLTEYMLTENEKFNLTAITDIDKIILHHYADCAALAVRLPRGATVADIGCGAGFPTLPVAILRDDVKITAIDSTAKRVNYVKAAAEMLGLSNVVAVAMRAEEGALMPEYREKYDVATARAVAELRVLTELCMGYVRCGGRFIAMKGKSAELELSGAKRAIAIMGGKGVACEDIRLTGEGDELTHPLIVIEKKAKCPVGYPRPYAKISKKPL